MDTKNLKKLRIYIVDDHKLFREEFEIDVEQIQPDAPLMQTLELDSLDLVDMVVLIDKNFGFTVTAKDFAGIKTFQDFYNLVISHMQKED